MFQSCSRFKGAVHTVAGEENCSFEIGYWSNHGKSCCGGGGRGKRLIKEESEFDQLFMAASSEALAAFGGGTMYFERFINNPRHIEVQVVGDSHGNAIHIGELRLFTSKKTPKSYWKNHLPFY